MFNVTYYILHVSMAPRLHCISYRRLGSSYPLLHPVHVPEYAESKADDNLIESTNQSVNLWADQTVTHTAVSSTENKATKEWILNRIAKVLGGDRTAAEYVLLCVLSRTYGRDYTGANLLLGTLSITLNGFTVSDRRIEKLREVLSEFVPLCVKVIISLFLFLQVTNFLFEFSYLTIFFFCVRLFLSSLFSYNRMPSTVHTVSLFHTSAVNSLHDLLFIFSPTLINEDFCRHIYFERHKYDAREELRFKQVAASIVTFFLPLSNY